MRNSKKKRTVRFAEGDRIWSKAHGYGVVVKVDPKDSLFRYNVSFRDGTSLWYDGRGTEKA